MGGHSNDGSEFDDLPRGRACSGASLNRQLLPPPRLCAFLASPVAFDVGRAETLQLAMAACIGLFACPSLSPYEFAAMEP